MSRKRGGGWVQDPRGGVRGHFLIRCLGRSLVVLTPVRDREMSLHRLEEPQIWVWELEVGTWRVRKASRRWDCI